MEWQEEDQSNDSSESELKSEMENSDDRDENDINTIRDELKSMSFAELLKLKEKLGSKTYNEAVFGETATSTGKKRVKRNEFKRENKNRPREISAKKQVPLLGGLKVKKNDQGPRDPRFDKKCGEFDRDKFNENYSFVGEMRVKEISQLKKQLIELNKNQMDKKQKIKYVLQRMQNQQLEGKKLKERKLAVASEKNKNKKAIKNERKPFFIPKREQKAKDLVKQFEELKKSGKLNKHLETRRKKNMARDRKKYNFD